MVGTVDEISKLVVIVLKLPCVETIIWGIIKTLAFGNYKTRKNCEIFVPNMYIYTLNNVKNLDALAFEQFLRAKHEVFIKTIVTFPIANSVS